MNAEASSNKPALEVTPHPGSNFDTQSRLFTSHGRILRGVNDVGVRIYRDLEEKGILKRLFDERLMIETWEPEDRLPGWTLLLEHRRVPFVITPSEWSAEMFYEAGKLILRIQRIITEHGYTLYDPHPWNVLFDGPRPVYIDIGSIRPADPEDYTWVNFDTVEQSVLHSLRILNAGQGRAFRGLFRDYNHFPTRWEIEALAGPPGLERRLRNLARKVLQRLEYRRRKLIARKVVQTGGTLGSTVPDLPPPESLEKVPRRLHFLKRMARWFDQQKPPQHEGLNAEVEPDPPIDRPDQWTGWEPLIAEWIDKLGPGSAVEIGEADGWYARLAASRGADALFLEEDEERANAHYLQVKNAGSSAVPVVASARYPTPGYGVQNKELPAATSRLRGELVIAIGVDPDDPALFEVPPAMTARMVMAFSKRWVLFEFPAVDEDFLEEWSEMGWGPFSAQAYIDAFTAMGSKAQVIATREDGSAMLFCEHEPRQSERKDW